MTHRKRYFDEKFSREFFIKVPFLFYLKNHLFHKRLLFNTLQKSPIFRKITAKGRFVEKNRKIRAVFCQNIQHF